MLYSSFTIAQVKRQFKLNIIKGAFFADLPLLAPRTWFKEYLQESASFAAGQGSEKVRSELIVAPLLFELRVLLVGVASPRRIVRLGCFLGLTSPLMLNLG